MSEFNQARREGFVKFGYDFNSLAEVTHVWELTAMRLPYSVSFRIPGVDDTIALLISENGGRGWRNIPHRGLNIDNRGHRQIVRIDEVNADKKVSEERCRTELEKPLKRYVFWRESRDGEQWYKFQGVFSIDVEATKASLEAGDNVCGYVKIADECPCPKADWHLAEIGDVDFAGYAKHVVEAVLLDEIDYRFAADDGTTGNVKVWPGQKLFVNEVTPDGVRAVCRSADRNLRSSVKRCGGELGADVEFFIPRRDFELGYFRVLPGEATLDDTFATRSVEIGEEE